jgi:Skp family chaperone for outer membrane proteins
MPPPTVTQRWGSGAPLVGVFHGLFVGLAVAICLALPVAAQQDAVTEPEAVAGILILNQERLFAQSLYGQRIQRELEDASARLAAENRRIEAELTEEELALTERRATMDADAFREEADAFDARVEAIRGAQEAKARDLTGQADAAQVLFFERVAPVLLDIVRDRNAAVLMDSRAVLLSADRVDVTETAIAAIDERLGEGGPEPIISLETETGPDPANPDAP